jgi:alpha-glucosidase (family GH31 glycosyl hydrolase)
MQLSVSGIMLMNMFGIPMVGADICGFLGDTNKDLCTKWHYVGAFYPFSRNHNGGNVAQEPYVWDKPVMQAMTDAIKIKYALIRYYYTELFAMSTMDGEGTFYKPLFFEFPEDEEASKNIEFNIMLGSALKLSIDSGNRSFSAKEMRFYFPLGTWCLLMGTSKFDSCFTNSGNVGAYQTFPSDLTDYQVHLREGFIVPLQDTMSKQAKPFNTSKDLQSQPVDFHILGKETNYPEWQSSGRYINDDGLSLNITGNYNSYNIKAAFDGNDNITVNFEMRE